MSIAADFPFVETGDNLQEFELWRLRRVDDRNSDRGRFYVDSDSADVRLYNRRDKPASSLVAIATGTTGQVDFVAQNNSGLEGSVFRKNGSTTGNVTVFHYLCGGQDIREYDDRAEEMLINGEVDFEVALRQMMRAFLLQMAAEYPPPPGVSPPLRFVQTEIEEGVRGTPEWGAQYFWSLAGNGEWEMTGLQNPSDYRNWAIYKTLELVYDRKARSGDLTDAVFARARYFEDRAMKAWKQARPWVDFDGDLLPDRQPKNRTPKLRRG